MSRTRPVMPDFGAQAPIEHEVLGPDGIRLAAFEYPATAAADDSGTGSGGDSGDEVTVVLAHGWTNDHRVWEPVIAGLQERTGVRVVSYDHPGHGRSGESPARRPAVRELADSLRAVVDALAPTGDLVLGGHSMGGMTLMALAGKDPEWLRERARGVALVSTAAHIDNRRPVPGERVVMGLSAALPARIGSLPLPEKMVREGTFGLDPDPKGVTATLVMSRGTSARSTGRYFAALSLHDEVASLPAFAAVPTEIITGVRDRLTPAKSARKMATRIPGATLRVVPGKGHMLPYEATDLLVERFTALLARR